MVEKFVGYIQFENHKNPLDVLLTDSLISDIYKMNQKVNFVPPLLAVQEHISCTVGSAGYTGKVSEHRNTDFGGNSYFLIKTRNKDRYTILGEFTVEFRNL